MLCWSLYPPRIGILWLSLLLCTHFIHFSPLVFFLTLPIILSVYLWFVTFFTLCFQTILFFFELHIDIPNSKTKNKQTKKKQLKRCFTPHCREYCCHHILSSVQRKYTHGICYWLAPNLILNKCACFSSQFFP